MVTAATAHVAELTAAFVTLFTNLKTDFVAKRDAQLLLIGGVKGLKKATAINRDVLEKQMMTNLLTVALNNIGNPDAIDIYFDQSFLKPASQKTFSGKVGAGKLVNVDSRKYSIEQVITLYNEGDTALSFGLSETKDAASLTQLKIASHTERKIKASELGDVNICKFLNVTNPDLGIEGAYKVVVDL
jgi:ribosomal protein L21E